MKIFIETHGCQMNFSDTEIVGGLLEANGVSVVDNLDDADGVFVNTCAIRENAEEKVYHRVQQLSYLKRRKPDLIIGILGCLAQSLKEDILEYSSAVDLVVGPDSYRSLPELLAKLAPGELNKIVETKLSRTENYTDIPTLRKSGVNAWVTIMRGCDNFCTFCVVPYTRGRERSRSADLILKEVESLAAAGFVQVTLLGQNVNSYRTENADFAELVRRVARVPGIERVRFTSPHPKDFPEELLHVMAEEPAACPHIHLPLQSGSDRVLERMNRGYTGAEYRTIVDRIRTILPDAAITTDLIAGFPGETEDDFEATLTMMRDVRYASSFTFAYSERRNTVASRRMNDDVAHEVKIERVTRMVDCQREISRAIHSESIGRVMDVLVESHSRKTANMAFGRNPQGIGVVFPCETIQPGERIAVVVEEATTNTLIGRRAESPAFEIT